MTTQQYQQASEHSLAQARQELAAGDLPQASEKGWRAIAQILKAIAGQRGWQHNPHRRYHRIISRIRAETGDRDIRRLFNTASALQRTSTKTTCRLTTWPMASTTSRPCWTNSCPSCPRGGGKFPR